MYLIQIISFLFAAYPLSGMITVPVSAGTYQAVVASMQPGGGITLQSATEALGGSAGNAFQLIGTPLQLANGQIIGKKHAGSAHIWLYVSHSGFEMWTRKKKIIGF